MQVACVFAAKEKRYAIAGAERVSAPLSAPLAQPTNARLRAAHDGRTKAFRGCG